MRDRLITEKRKQNMDMKPPNRAVLHRRTTMDNFKAIYTILKALEAAMDYPEFDISQVSHSELGVSQERWARYIEMMADIELIKGVRVYKNITGSLNVDAENIRITLKGLEYLTENSIMQKLYRAAKGIKEVVPFT